MPTQITSPILLDSTGQDINETLENIRDILSGAATLINDEKTSKLSTWSSAKIIETFAADIEDFSVSTDGHYRLSFYPIAATPLYIEAEITDPTEISLTLSTSESDLPPFVYSIYVPIAGTLNLSTGELLAQGVPPIYLQGISIMAKPALNTIVMNVPFKVTYKTFSSASGSSPTTWDIICGGTAATI